MIKIYLIFFFILSFAFAQANADIKKLEDVNKTINEVDEIIKLADTLKIEVAIKGKRLLNFFTNNNLILISENESREYKFKDTTYEIIKDGKVVQSGIWKIKGLLKNQIMLISDEDKKKYYLKKIAKKPLIYNYDKPPASEGAIKKILHIKSSSKFSDVSSDTTIIAGNKVSTNSSKSNKNDRLNINVIMANNNYRLFQKNIDNKVVLNPEIKKLTLNNCLFSNTYLKNSKQLLYLSNDGISRTLEEIYEANGSTNIQANLLNYIKQFLKEEYDFRGELQGRPFCNDDFTRFAPARDDIFEILVLPKGLKVNEIYVASYSGQGQPIPGSCKPRCVYKSYPLKSYFQFREHSLKIVKEIDINKLNNSYASANSEILKSRENKKNEIELVRSLASKNDRNHVLMYVLRGNVVRKTMNYCVINNSNYQSWDSPLMAYIHYGYNNFHETDFTKHINLVKYNRNIKNSYNPSLRYDEKNKSFYFSTREGLTDKATIATKNDLNEFFLGIKNKKYACDILVGYPQDLIKITDALKRDNYFDKSFPLQGKLRKVSILNDKYDQLVKLWEEYYINERKLKAANDQAFLEKYGKLISKYPNCATTYYYIKNKIVKSPYNSSQYHLLMSLKSNIEGLVEATGGPANDNNSRMHCQNFLIMAYES
tara:strand:- start:152 stop:2113 length:1962 start_codon:yes stop_codon:yes gene_type:complete